MYDKNGKCIMRFPSKTMKRPVITASAAFGQAAIPKDLLDRIKSSQPPQASFAFTPQPWATKLPAVSNTDPSSSASASNSVDPQWALSTQVRSSSTSSDTKPHDVSTSAEINEWPINIVALQDQIPQDTSVLPQLKSPVQDSTIHKENTSLVVPTVCGSISMTYRKDVDAYNQLARVCHQNGLPPPLIEVTVVHLSDNTMKFAASVTLGHMGKCAFHSQHCDFREDAREQVSIQALEALKDIGLLIRQKKQARITDSTLHSSPAEADPRLPFASERGQSPSISEVALVDDRQPQDRIDGARGPATVNFSHVKDHQSESLKLERIQQAPARLITDFSRDMFTNDLRIATNQPRVKRSLKRDRTEIEQPKSMPQVSLDTIAKKPRRGSVLATTSQMNGKLN